MLLFLSYFFCYMFCHAFFSLTTKLLFFLYHVVDFIFYYFHLMTISDDILLFFLHDVSQFFSSCATIFMVITSLILHLYVILFCFNLHHAYYICFLHIIHQQHFIYILLFSKVYHPICICSLLIITLYLRH